MDLSMILSAFPQAINTVIQGSAADLMKAAMINMAANLMRWQDDADPNGLRPRMLWVFASPTDMRKFYLLSLTQSFVSVHKQAPDPWWAYLGSSFQWGRHQTAPGHCTQKLLSRLWRILPSKCPASAEMLCGAKLGGDEGDMIWQVEWEFIREAGGTTW